MCTDALKDYHDRLREDLNRDPVDWNPDVPASEIEEAQPRPDFEVRLECILNDIRVMLVSKNTAYGNSALDPVRIFSTTNPVEQIKVRIDDKLSRLVRGSAAGEDVATDLIGYLILLRMAQDIEMEKRRG